MSYRDRYTIRPEDVLGRFIVQPLAGRRFMTRQVQVQQLTNLLDRAPIINQMYGPQAVKMVPLLAHIMEEGFDIRNAEDFLTMPPEATNLMTALQEHALWYHGEVPPRRQDDNDARHVLVHFEEFETEQFASLENSSPGTAARARKHVEDHMMAMASRKEYEEKMMADFQQMAAQQGMAGGGENGQSATPGAAGPEQDAESPKIRKNEGDRGEGQKNNATANQGAPNPGHA